MNDEFVILTKEDFDYLIERSLELCEFHHDEIRDIANQAMIISFAEYKGPTNA